MITKEQFGISKMRRYMRSLTSLEAACSHHLLPALSFLGLCLVLLTDRDGLDRKPSQMLMTVWEKTVTAILFSLLYFHLQTISLNCLTGVVLISDLSYRVNYFLKKYLHVTCLITFILKRIENLLSCPSY